jgi:formylglycine-generating enzyme required for sulfatase activity
MEPSLQTLFSRLEHLTEQFRELREGVHKAVDIASRDPEMALTRARKVLEYVIRDVYQRRLKEPPGTRPLENLLQRLVKDGHFPDRLDAYANTIRKLGNVGTHAFGEKVTGDDVYQSLSQLTSILEWYFEQERPDAVVGQPAREQPPPPPDPVEPPEPLAGPAPGAAAAVVPKGLRSFDAQDADFFLDLLPGPRDRAGLPESIRFWKHRIEGRDEPAFPVGVLYGPSGCGKSSLVKAGLLPRLAGHVLPVYVEATAEDTEARLLHGLRRRCPALSADLALAAALAALRQGRALRPGQKVFLVLDQFEQWLHARRGEGDTELARALRQCDGEHVQCLVLVRDDFWMALTRFMQELQSDLVPGQNTAVVDLFDLRHARKVLTAFGRAFGALPETLSRGQEAFLDQAVVGLSQDGRVISVRLALFADMMKGKAWTGATLKALGGTEGVGVTFLEETFSSPVASRKNRLHQEAARSVLGALLPEQACDIRGTMRSRDRLREASGYARRPQDFEALLRILDGETRLITPADPEGRDEGRGMRDEPEAGTPLSSLIPLPSSLRYYQLTHDYLVPALRDWLTRKQKETRRGRAELLLADRAAVCNVRPEGRQLPSLVQWLQIRWHTRKRNWTPPQRQMMARAGRYHAVRGALVAGLLAVATAAGLLVRERLDEQRKATHAAGLVQGLVNADTTQVPALVGQMADYRKWVDPLLREEYARTAANSRPKLHASLALLPADASQVAYLYGRLLDAGPAETPVLRDALAPHTEQLVDRLWAVVQSPGKESQRLRAAAALARYDPASAKWAKAREAVANDLVTAPAVYLAVWMDALRPVGEKLLPPLSAVYRDATRRETERWLATAVLADYAADNPQLLADLLLDADEKQFAVLYPKLQAQGGPGLPLLAGELDKKLPPDLPSSDERRERLAKRQANAAVALLRMNEPAKVWPLLRRGSEPDDPRVRSYLIHRLGPLGADGGALVRRLDGEPDISARRALVLSLGGYGDKGLLPETRKALLPKLRDAYRTAPDPGLHAAAEWLLRTWRQEAWLKQVNDRWAGDREGREERLESIRQSLSTEEAKAPPQWYVNGQGQTMVVIPGPVEFLMGSPYTEAGRGGDEQQHRRRISRTFAIAAKPVTVRQYREFCKGYKVRKEAAPTEDCPVHWTDWHMAAAYCNWLSEREGIPPDQWCYETGPHGRVTRLKENYLGRTGYRLPTEAEWEYACRAGAATSRHFGESEELLKEYAWYLPNGRERSRPVGGKKPNDLGLFDLHGNVWAWCQERYKAYPEASGDGAVEDEEDILEVKDGDIRVLRGGSFNNHAVAVRSANRSRYAPAGRDIYVGFRPARTLATPARKSHTPVRRAGPACLSFVPG